MAKTISYINTTPKGKRLENQAQGNNSYLDPYYGQPGKTLNMTEVLARVMPLIAENYADSVSQLSRGSLLFNPAFADNAEGWSFSGTVEISESDAKNRIFLQDGAMVSQQNGLIRKPGKHLLYNYDETGQQSASPEESGTGRSADTLVTEPPQWEEIQKPVQVTGAEERNNEVYLEVKFVCHKSGTLQVGFYGSDESSENAFKSQTIYAEASETVQIVRAEGTWDGTGNFGMSFSTGRMEVVSLSLTDKPLMEFRKEAESFFAQALQNLRRLFDTARQLISHIQTIRSEINVLYGNDAILDGFISDLGKEVEDMNGTISKHGERMTAIEEEDKTLVQSISELASSVSSLQSGLSDLGKRVDDIEKSLSGTE